MKKNTLQIVITLLIFVGGFTYSDGQVLLKEVALESQINNSNLVVEGEVIAKKSFWDAEEKHIYTANTIQVHKVFKGETLAIIEVITLGGTVGLQSEIVRPSLKLNKGDVGMFALYNNDVMMKSTEKSAVKQFRPYGSSQGFYKYNLYDNLAVNTFNIKKGITSSFYDEIKSNTKTNYIELSSFNPQTVYLKMTQSKSALAPGAISFSPTVATAGTKTVLTITGTGFGTTKGKVSFKNADDGGITFIDALSTQILTWNNTTITVEIPSEAGTGVIMVTDASDTSAVSSAELQINYSEINAIQDGGDTAYKIQHVNDNNSGGYTWQMFTDFNNNVNAKAAFMRAFDSWRCTTGINWTLGATTTIDAAAKDGINVIRFDNGDELVENELGRCTFYLEGCIVSSTINWYVVELDVVFDDGTNWNYSSATSSTGLYQYDFESNALHELGHGHLLGHVIDTEDVMNYAISNSEEQRVLGALNIQAANTIQSRSTGTMVCLKPSMSNHPCYLSVEEEELNASINIYPNPAKGEFNIKNNSLINLESVVVYDVSGRLISQYDLTNAQKVKNIDLSRVSKGVYFVRIASDRAEITRKLVVE